MAWNWQKWYIQSSSLKTRAFFFFFSWNSLQYQSLITRTLAVLNKWLPHELSTELLILSLNYSDRQQLSFNQQQRAYFHVSLLALREASISTDHDDMNVQRDRQYSIRKTRSIRESSASQSSIRCCFSRNQSPTEQSSYCNGIDDIELWRSEKKRTRVKTIYLSQSLRNQYPEEESERNANQVNEKGRIV